MREAFWAPTSFEESRDDPISLALDPSPRRRGKTSPPPMEMHRSRIIEIKS